MIKAADLFCGAGGTSTGLVEAINALGHEVDLTAVNHWERAVETHQLNHPGSRHFNVSIDDLNPRHLFPDGLDVLWASPECTHHSNARGGRPMNDQSRATAWCVTRWAEALQPKVILVENVPEFLSWGGLGADGRPLKSKKGHTFRAWVATLESLGYRVDWRILCAADYGDPTTRKRLFIQAVRGKRKIVWPDPTHGKAEKDLFGSLQPWRSAENSVIDWSIPAPSIHERKRPLAPKTLQRIRDGLNKYGGEPFIVAMEHGGRVVPASNPVPTVTCAKGGAFGVAYVLPQQSGGALKPASESMPTVATSGAIALVVEYYGNGKARPITEPLPTVTCRDRFGLVTLDGRDIGFRMFKPHELAAAQGFRKDYKFAGNQTEVVKQIGNAVPRRLARALALAVWGQDNDIAQWIESEVAA